MWKMLVGGLLVLWGAGILVTPVHAGYPPSEAFIAGHYLASIVLVLVGATLLIRA